MEYIIIIILLILTTIVSTGKNVIGLIWFLVGATLFFRILSLICEYIFDWLNGFEFFYITYTIGKFVTIIVGIIELLVVLIF